MGAALCRRRVGLERGRAIPSLRRRRTAGPVQFPRTMGLVGGDRLGGVGRALEDSVHGEGQGPGLTSGAILDHGADEDHLGALDQGRIIPLVDAGAGECALRGRPPADQGQQQHRQRQAPGLYWSRFTVCGPAARERPPRNRQGTTRAGRSRRRQPAAHHLGAGGPFRAVDDPSVAERSARTAWRAGGQVAAQCW